MSAPDVVAALAARGVGDVDDSDLARTLYSSDASVYRVPPRVVVRPRHVDSWPRSSRCRGRRRCR